MLKKEEGDHTACRAFGMFRNVSFSRSALFGNLAITFNYGFKGDENNKQLYCKEKYEYDCKDNMKNVFILK